MFFLFPVGHRIAYAVATQRFSLKISCIVKRTCISRCECPPKDRHGVLLRGNVLYGLWSTVDFIEYISQDA